MVGIYDQSTLCKYMTFLKNNIYYFKKELKNLNNVVTEEQCWHVFT